MFYSCSKWINLSMIIFIKRVYRCFLFFLFCGRILNLGCLSLLFLIWDYCEVLTQSQCWIYCDALNCCMSSALSVTCAILSSFSVSLPSLLLLLLLFFLPPLCSARFKPKKSASIFTVASLTPLLSPAFSLLFQSHRHSTKHVLLLAQTNQQPLLYGDTEETVVP